MAGALSRRDIEMIFRADTDKATRPIADLVKDVRALRGALADQIKMADKGDASLEALAGTTRDLKKAQDELGSARSMLTSLNAQIASLEKAEARLAETGAKYAELKNQVDQAEKPTKRLTNAMEAAGRANAAAADQVARINAEVADTRQRVEGIIGPVENFSQSFQQIANTSKEIARGLAVAGNAAQDFQVKINAAKAAEDKLGSDVAFEQSGRSAGLLQAQIDYLSQFENRVELLAQAKRELAQQNAAFDAALNAQGAREGAANVNALRAAFEQTAAEEARITQINAFRQIAADANAAATDVSRFGVAADTGGASASRLAAALQEIIAPASTANQSISGLESNITQAAAVLDGNTKSAATYNAAMNELVAANAAAVRQAGQIDGYRAQEAALAASTAGFQHAQAEVRRLATELATTDAPTQEMAQALKVAQANLETAGTAMQADTAKLQALGAALQKAGHDTNDLTTSEQRLTKATQEAARAQAAIAAKTKGTTNAFGLSLQDAQNLGYQVNDIVTQLASGQSIFRALAQQGGQIYQIPAISGFIAQYAKFIPIVGALAAAFAVLYGAVSRSNDKMAETRNAEGYIASLGQAGSLTAQQIGAASVQMQDLGVKAEDARSALHDFNEGGLDPKYLDSFTQAAKNASDVTGKDFKDAFSALTGVMSGGYDEVEKLQKAFPVLSDAELVHIRAMYDSGNASEARRIVFERFYDKMDEGASKMRGEWSNAVDNFKAAFRSFLDWLGSTTVIQDFVSSVNDALVGLNYLLLRARGFNHQQAGNAAVNRGGMAPGTRPTGGAGPAAGNQHGTSAAGQEAIQDAQRELDVRKRLTKEERLRNAEIAARRKAPSGATDDERNTLATLARQKELNAIRDEDRRKSEAAGKKSDAARKRAEAAAEALRNKIAAAEESLQSALDGMDSKVAKTAQGSLTDQLQAAAVAVQKEYDKLLRKAEDFRKLTGGKGNINGQSIDDYEAQVRSNEKILTQQAQLGVYEKNVNDLLAQRKALLADIEDKQNRGQITSADAVKQAGEVTSTLNTQIGEATAQAVAFAKAIGGAHPSPDLQAFIQKMTTAGDKSTGFGDLAGFANKEIGQEENKLNEIISQRNSLIAANNQLVELGAMSQTDANKAAQAAFTQTQPLIDKQIESMRALIEQAHNLRDASGAPLITDEAYAAWQAKLNAIGVQAQYTDSRMVQLKQNIQGVITDNAVTAFDKIASTFAKVAVGAESIGKGLKEAGMAMVSFIADTLIQIGKLIIQAVIMKAVDAATGGMLSLLLGATSAAKGGGGGGGGGLLGGLAKIFHSGTNSVGDSSSGVRTRRLSVTPAMLSSIPRYHQGTQGVGLDHSEQLAVVQKGEKILTEEQQRREAAASKGPRGGTGLRQVLAFGDDQVAAAMAGAAGERTTVTHLRRNVPLLKQMLRD